MKVYNDMCELLEKELGQMVSKGDITPTELESAYKSIDIIKDIETIKAMRNEYGHSSNNSYNGSYGSYDTYRDMYRPEWNGRYSRDNDNEVNELRRELHDMRSRMGHM